MVESENLGQRILRGNARFVEIHDVFELSIGKVV